MEQFPLFDPAHPDLQGDLTEVIAPDEIPIRFVNQYRAIEKVRCAFCANRTEHNKGVTAEMKDGRIALCGINCAVKHFGTEVFRDLHAELARREASYARRRQLEPAFAGAKVVAEQLLRWLPVEILIDEVTEAFQEELARTHYQRHMTDSGTLQRESHESKKIVGTVHGAHLLTLESARFRNAHGKLLDIVTLSNRDPSSVNDDIVTRALDLKRKALRDLEAGIERLEVAQKFLVEDNINELQKWARQVWDRSPKIQWKKRGQGAAILIKPPMEDIMWDLIVPDFNETPNEADLILPLRARGFDVAA